MRCLNLFYASLNRQCFFPTSKCVVLPRLFLSFGKPAIINLLWRNVVNVQGRVWDSESFQNSDSEYRTIWLNMSSEYEPVELVEEQKTSKANDEKKRDVKSCKRNMQKTKRAKAYKPQEKWYRNANKALTVHVTKRVWKIFVPVKKMKFWLRLMTLRINKNKILTY